MFSCVVSYLCELDIIKLLFNIYGTLCKLQWFLAKINCNWSGQRILAYLRGIPGYCPYSSSEMRVQPPSQNISQ